MPIVIFYGDRDEVTYCGSPLKLKEQFKRQGTLIALVVQGHNGMTNNPDWETGIQKILNRE